jgi:hypothetical protein
MTCYVLDESEFNELLKAFRLDQEEDRLANENYWKNGIAPLKHSLWLWCKAAEMVRRKGDAVPASFHPMIWLTPSAPFAPDRYHLTTLKEETP